MLPRTPPGSGRPALTCACRWGLFGDMAVHVEARLPQLLHTAASGSLNHTPQAHISKIHLSSGSCCGSTG